jgi:beta-fructofuranosidase
MGLPDEIDQPSTDSGWVHQLTTMREMSVRNGRLIQWPIEELNSLIESEETVVLSNHLFNAETKSYDLTLTLEWGMSLNLFEGAGNKVVLHADNASKCLVLDRSQTLNRANDTVRELPLTSEKIALRILADTSSIEVFVNGGEAVMTSRVFASNTSTSLSVNGGVVEAILKRLTSATAPFVQ